MGITLNNISDVKMMNIAEDKPNIFKYKIDTEWSKVNFLTRFKKLNILYRKQAMP